MSINFRRLLGLLSLGLVQLAAASAADWKPADGPLLTRWAKDVSPAKVHPEYPRPQLVRKQWQNLNGLWDYAIRPKTETKADKFAGQILVPFPLESALSGVMQRIDETQRLWYRRTFATPPPTAGQRTLLHFGAVDWQATVWIDGSQVGSHEGGYDPFTLDITDALKAVEGKPEGMHEILVAVWDPTDRGPQPRGKQVQKPEGIWYTPTSGIWQTVWLETVAPAYIATLKITPEVDKSQVRIAVDAMGVIGDALLSATVHDGDREIGKVEGRVGEELIVKIPQPKLWTPDEPHLYDVKVSLSGKPIAARDDKATAARDEVTSYFGMRTIALAKDGAGAPRIVLNGKPLFQYGPLDQGFWPDGLYTAPTDEALRYDIEVTKRLGFNMARKHVKVEPQRWYYWCDKLGLIVWQDMPSGDGFPANGKIEIERSKESIAQYDLELRRMIETLYNHPSIVMWVPFNEGWGQFDTKRVVALTKQLDPTRLVDCASGWHDVPTGDVHDIHVYPGPAAPAPESARASVLGEFGGLGLPVRGHTWQAEKNWGYKSFTSPDALTDAYCGLMRRLHPLVKTPGLSAAVYTQTTDVEIEINGLMTYDRAIIKLDEKRLTAANRQLYLPPPTIKTIVATSEKEPQLWRYTFDKPGKDWFESSVNASTWLEGPGGFGTQGTPGATVKTVWNTPDVWLRRTIKLPDANLDRLALVVHHDEDVEIYLNGVLAAEATGFVGQYETLSISPAALNSLKPGDNVLAVHCHQTLGGQYIDVGLIDSIPAPTADTGGVWKSLFDGKSLTNWKATAFGGEGDIETEDGILCLKFGSPMTGVTWTGDKLPTMDYEVSLEAQRADGSDFFCGLTFQYGDSPCSLILGGWGGGVIGLSSIDGHDASENGTTKYREFKNGRWYRVRLKVTKGKIEAWLDDDQIVDADVAGKKISVRTEVNLCRPFGFASYATTAKLRNIQIRPLGKQ